uniref:Uncharacterized protein n=1 Tax=Octopus bimaculoides TaxID=37653 RepID=A0A0L8I3B6_OCTBM
MSDDDDDDDDDDDSDDDDDDDDDHKHVKNIFAYEWACVPTRCFCVYYVEICQSHINI